MLDNGKAQTRTAGCLGVAFIYTIEPLKDPVLMLGRNADTGIADGQTIVFCADRYTATGNILLDRIVAEIIDHLVEHSANTFHTEAVAGDLQHYLLIGGAGFQNGFYLFCQFQHIHFFLR